MVAAFAGESAGMCTTAGHLAASCAWHGLGYRTTAKKAIDMTCSLFRIHLFSGDVLSADVWLCYQGGWLALVSHSAGGRSSHALLMSLQCKDQDGYRMHSSGRETQVIDQQLQNLAT